ncbi:MAG: hypothetical protein RI924_88 [Bacteroidota bacterium]|jgi:FKBP-type peptidyl-prolyl cis-trans isomerase
MIKSVFPYFILFAVLLAGCTKEYSGIEELDSKSVADYIQKNNLTVQEYNQSGIFYQVLKSGSGPDIDFSKKIPLIYTVKSLDGSFSASDTFVNRYADFFGYFRPDSIREIIKSKLLKQGGSLRIIIPSRFAFGKSGSGGIPGNSSLDYTISMITADKLPEYEDYLITKYIEANNLTGFTKTASGLYYKVGEPGTGVETINNLSLLTLEYTGKLFNGTVFDKTNTGTTATFTLGNLVEGWKEGLPLIKKGGSIRLIIPSHLGYGLQGSGTIPPFSCLDFDINVKNVQ